MVTKEKLEALHRAKLGWKRKTLPLYVQKSIRVLAKVARRMSQHPLPHRGDWEQPFHLLVYVNGYTLSVFNSGFGDLIEIAEIDGEPRKQQKEVTFLTSKGAVNYVLRNYGV